MVWRLGDHYAVRDGDWKLVQFARHAADAVRSRQADPGERHNLAAEKPEELAELQATSTSSWNQQTVKPLWTTRGDLWVTLQDLLDGKPLWA